MLGDPIAQVGSGVRGIRRALVEEPSLPEGTALVGVGLEKVGAELEPFGHGDVLELRPRDRGVIEIGIGGRLLRVLVHRPAAREEEEDAGKGSTLHAVDARGARGEGGRILGSLAGGRKERVPRARSPSGRIGSRAEGEYPRSRGRRSGRAATQCTSSNRRPSSTNGPSS